MPYDDFGLSPYQGLVDTLTDLELPATYQCLPLVRRPRPGQATLLSPDGRRWIAQSRPLARTAKERLYSILAGALIQGTLNHLKVCPQCKKYFVTKTLKRNFCSTKCKDGWHNRERLNLMQRNREQKLNRARELKQEGKSVQVIMAKTELGKRTLKKAGITEEFSR